MQERQRVVDAALVNLREVADRSSEPDELVVGGELRNLRPPKGLRRILPQLPYLLLGRRIAREVPIAQPERSERQRPGANRPPILEPRELHAAAPDIHGHPARDGEVVDRAEEAQQRLAIAVDDLQVEPDLSARPLEEDVPVRRLANRGRRDGQRARRARAERDGPEVLQRLQRPIDGVVAEHVPVLERAPEAKRRPGILEDVQMARLARSKHHHPPGVRSDVDDRHRLLLCIRRRGLAPKETRLPHVGTSRRSPPQDAGAATPSWRPGTGLRQLVFLRQYSHVMMPSGIGRR